MTQMFTKRGIAKFATRCIVRSAVAQATLTTFNHVTDADPDTSNEAAEIGAVVVGLVVARRLGNHTDQMVERVADWRAVRLSSKYNPAV